MRVTSTHVATDYYATPQLPIYIVSRHIIMYLWPSVQECYILRFSKFALIIFHSKRILTSKFQPVESS